MTIQKLVVLLPRETIKTLNIMTGTELKFFEETLKRVGYKEHHTACFRGYCRRNYGWIERYNGRFGRGFLLHYPNCYYRNISSNYHTIVYIVER